MTPARLTEPEVTALAAKLFPSTDVQVVSFSLEAFSEEKLGYLGVHELLSIEVKIGESSKLLTFFVKSGAPTGTDFDALIIREECKFFAEVIPMMMDAARIQPWAAECYLAKEGLMVLEDLRAKGFRMVSNLTERELRSAVNCLARFHAASMLLEKRQGKAMTKLYPDSFGEKTFTNDGGFTWKWLLTGVEVAETVAVNLGLDPSLVMTAYCSSLKKFEPVLEGQNVLRHSDLWSNNLMFSEDGDDCRFVDYQMVSYGCYAVDLAQLIYLNATRETRRRLEKDLIGLYQSTLTEVLEANGFGKEEILNLEEVAKDFEDNRICGLVTAVQFFPIALLNKQEAEDYCKDVVRLEGYMYKSRKDFVLGVMDRDSKYKNRVEDSVRELVEFMALT